MMISVRKWNTLFGESRDLLGIQANELENNAIVDLQTIT